MRSPRPILMVAFDACDPALARNFAEQGHLPTLRYLFERSARCRVNNPVGLFVGALWMNFATGVHPDRHGFHCWDEIDVASYERRLTEPESREPTFWRQLGERGRRVAALDVPHVKIGEPVNGIELAEWGCHDRHFGLRSWPAVLAGDIESAFGLHPIFGADAYEAKQFAPDDYVLRAGDVRTLDEERALLDGLCRGIEAKRRLSATLLAEDDWDLFLTIFGESHAVGHQQWHLHDASHPRFDGRVTEMLGGDPLLQVYRRLDAALADLLAAAGDDATVLVLLSHGMGPHYDGTHLLDEVLSRIDKFNGGQMQRGRADYALRNLMRSLPQPLGRAVTAFAVPAIRRRAANGGPTACREFVSAAERANQHFFLEPNNSVYGGVRLNVMGREPRGCVQPGDIDMVCAELTKDLLSLVNLDTGKPVVKTVERSDRYHRRKPDDTMPDLFVEWQRDALVETVWSPKTGIVHAPYSNWRSGDHRPQGLLLAMGPGIPTGTTLPSMQIEDFAPSLSARLGVELDDVDGRVVPWLAKPVA
jgi:predicted AlkP superfamily phosphohydrolase/phosphomutase